MNAQLVLGSYGLADVAGELSQVHLAALVPVQLLNNDQAWLPVRSGLKGGAAAFAQSGMDSLDGSLDILGVMIPSMNHQQVLETPGHEQLASLHETEVPRAEE